LDLNLRGKNKNKTKGIVVVRRSVVGKIVHDVQKGTIRFSLSVDAIVLGVVARINGRLTSHAKRRQF